MKKDCSYAAVVLLSLALISFFQILPSKKGEREGKKQISLGNGGGGGGGKES